MKQIRCPNFKQKLDILTKFIRGRNPMEIDDSSKFQKKKENVKIKTKVEGQEMKNKPPNDSRMEKLDVEKMRPYPTLQLETN